MSDGTPERESLRERIGAWIWTLQFKATVFIYNFLTRLSRKLLCAMDYPESRVVKLTAELSSDDAEIRGRSAHHLGNAAELGVDMSAAMPLLVRMLAEELNLGGSSPSKNAEETLKRAVANENNRDAALFALASALYDDNPDVRKEALKVLKRTVETCGTAEQLDRTVHWLREAHSAAGKKRELGPASVIYQVANMAAAQREALAEKRDILLDDVPKPPGRGRMYSRMRRAMRNG